MQLITQIETLLRVKLYRVDNYVKSTCLHQDPGLESPWVSGTIK